MKLKQLLRLKGNKKPSDEEVLKIFKEEVINKDAGKKTNLFPFKTVSTGEMQSLEKVEANILELESRIDQIAYKINLVKSKVEKEIDEVSENISGIKLNMLEAES